MILESITNIWSLIVKDFRIELRQRYVLSAILLYVVSTVFIISKILQTVSPMLWNAVFWIIFMFTAVNALMKSFVQEISGRELYYYALVGPVELLVAKFLYNFLNLCFMSLLLLLSFTIFVGNPVNDYILFLAGILSGALSISLIFTLVAAIASKGGNSATLMSVLSIPLTLPVILLSLKITGAAVGILSDTGIVQDLFLIIAIVIIIVGVSLLLFPQIWRT